MQLDIFAHSREVMLRNDVIAALERRDAGAARAARLALLSECASDETLGSQAVLIDALVPAQTAPFTNHAAARQARLKLAEEIEPSAQRLLGEALGRDWAVPLWRELAERSAPLAFRADFGGEHAASLWLRAGNWARAADAAAGVESWQRIPAPLGWMTEARYRIEGLDATWPLLTELAWLAPRRFDAVLRTLCDPYLNRLHRKFDTEFDGDSGLAGLAWFPAWLLTDTPALARFIGQAQPSRQEPAEQAMRLLADLLELERQGRHRDLVDRRRKLQGLNATLYAAYMATR